MGENKAELTGKIEENKKAMETKMDEIKKAMDENKAEIKTEMGEINNKMDILIKEVTRFDTVSEWGKHSIKITEQL